jgi:hypothetical protein
VIVLPQWQFVEDEHHKWHWTRTGPDQVRIQSATSFDNRIDCVQDAARLVKTAALRSSSPKPADTIHFG